MTVLTPFIEKGNWYMGNIHTHSTVSDGALTPEALKEEYMKRGYHFMLFSEHQIHTDFSMLNEKNFIVLQGFEGNPSKAKDDFRDIHMHFIAGPKELRDKAILPMFKHLEKVPRTPFTSMDTIQEYIDDKIARGYMVMMNHPHWSAIEYDEIFKLKGLFAIEIYNHGAENHEGRGRSTDIWDALLRRGMKLWGMAGDDNHNRNGLDSVYNDSFGGFIVVKAESLTEEDISRAIYTGSFYASEGPRIYDFRVEDNFIVLECSPVKKIIVNGDQRYGQAVVDINGNATYFKQPLRGKEQYIRAEIIDSGGKRAYTNPIYLSGFPKNEMDI